MQYAAPRPPKRKSGRASGVRTAAAPRSREALRASFASLEASHAELRAASQELLDWNAALRRKADAAAVDAAALRRQLDHVDFALMVIDDDGIVASVNAAAVRAFELPADALRRRWASIEPGGELGRALAGLVARARASGVACATTLDDAHGVWHTVSVTPMADAGAAPAGWLVRAVDVSAQRDADEQARITARVFEQAAEAIVVTDARGRCQTVNPALRRLTGLVPSLLVGRPAWRLLTGDRGRLDTAARRALRAVARRGHWRGELRVRRSDGVGVPAWVSLTRVDDAARGFDHFIAVFSDITALKDTQARVEYLATHDPLTGLANRTLFLDHLRLEIAHARRESRGRLAVLFVDLDHFKRVNDAHGHAVGDALLREAARRLRALVRDSDTVARLGGDEFTVVMPRVGTDAALEVARRALAELSRGYVLPGTVEHVAASVGVAFYPDDGLDEAALLKAADAAMYRAKELGRGRVEVFHPELQRRHARRAAVERALRRALAHGRVGLAFQPKVTLDDAARLVGAESLLRIVDPELGALDASECVSVAETCALMTPLTQAVVATVVDHLVDWRARGLDVPPLAVNVSARNLREPAFADGVLDALRAVALPPTVIMIEITEEALVEHSDVVLGNLQRLHAAGIAVAIDDFGTGFSSLAYLKRLPIAQLKIDRAFVAGLGAGTSDEAIARAVLALARALELTTVAEGVETAAQRDWLRAHGCDAQQGFLSAPPLAPDAFAQRLRGARDEA